VKRTVLIALAAVALAGCGGSDYGGGSSSSTKSAAASSAPTLYTFSKDSSGKSNCSGACAKSWPPATSAPRLDKAKLSTIKRSDGKPQIALDGRPLYSFAGDTKPGDANGQGSNAFGGLWTVARSAAKSSKPAPSRGYGY
jgi:predicted lipoprotein with Yx(FWY)xxD motif